MQVSETVSCDADDLYVPQAKAYVFCSAPSTLDQLKMSSQM